MDYYMKKHSAKEDMEFDNIKEVLLYRDKKKFLNDIEILK